MTNETDLENLHLKNVALTLQSVIVAFCNLCNLRHVMYAHFSCNNC
jgi:hypothetical protein